MMMRLKRPGLVTVAIGTLAAILASSASAKVETVEAEWYTGNPLATTVTADKSLKTQAGEHLLPDGTTSKKITFGGTIFGIKYDLTATGVECLECAITNGTTNAEKAMGRGKLKFTGVTVMAPAGCLVEGGTITTNALTTHADWMHEGKAFVKFEPTAGPAAALLTVSITECALASTFAVKGYVFGEMLSNTGVAAEEQPITFSEAIYKTTESTLSGSGKPLLIEGRLITELNPKAPFGLK